MNDKYVPVVEKQIERLHTELMERIRSFSALWRSVLLGVAGILALGDKADLNLVLILSLPLVLLALGHWLHEQGSMVVAAKGIAEEERKLNTLAGTTLLNYETRRAAKRKTAWEYRLWFLAFAVIAVASLTVLTVDWILGSQAATATFSNRDDLELAYRALMTGACFTVVYCIFRIYMLVHR